MTNNKQKKKEALEIAKRFPLQIKIIPRASFEEQLANFIVKEKLEHGR